MLKKLVATHGSTTECCIVLAITLGLFVASSVASAVSALAAGGLSGFVTATSVSDQRLVGTAVFEIALTAVVAPYLVLRGWTLSRFRVEPSFNATVLGIALFAAGELSALALQVLFSPLLSSFYGDHVDSLFRVSAGATPILALSIVNGTYEELFVVGYVIRSLDGKISRWTAINLSVALRLAYHLYQGPIAAATIIPLGLIFAWFYARHGKLWSLFVAHMLADFIALSLNR